MDLYSEIENYIPQKAVFHIKLLLAEYKPILKITKPRNTKLGDFRPSLVGNRPHIISVNSDLNQYSFVLTLVHEIAHLFCWEKNGRSVKPHGLEWKILFKELMLPILNPMVFPEELLKPLAKHLKNPKSSTVYDVNLKRVISNYDSNEKQFYLEDLHFNQSFRINKRIFIKLERQRTRYKCRDIANNRLYLINGVAAVEIVEN